MTNRDSTPVAAGYRWPAEWEPHAATWLAWPHNVATWPGTFARIPPQFAAFARTVADHEPVRILAGGADVLAVAKSHLGTAPATTFYDIPTNDAWCRDHGPTFLLATAATSDPPASRGERLALVDWRYNAWGEKYPPFDLDDRVPERIAAELCCRRFAVDLVVEGGAIEGNGAGTVLTTRSCLLHPNRNPGRSKAEIERCLSDCLQARQVLWLDRGELAGDDTDGHIDQLARFVGPRTIVAATTDDRSDPNYAPLRDNLAQLRGMVDQDGAAFEVVPLPLPQAKFQAGHRLPASYCNFYFVNGAVIVPQFEDDADAAAAGILGELLPGHSVIGLPALDLVWGLGAFHCLAQQQPLAHVDGTSQE